MNQSLLQTDRGQQSHNWGIGVLCGIAAALGYTLTSALLRELADRPVVVVATMKAFCTTAIFGPWLIFLSFHRQTKIWPPFSVCLQLLGAAVFVQICGNLFFQWSLGIVGMGVAVPLSLGTMIVFSAILGRVVLSEPISNGVAVSICVLVAAITMFLFARSDEGKTQGIKSVSSYVWILGAVAACVVGMTYSVLGVAIRTSMRHHIPLATPMIFVGLTGTLGLGSIGWSQGGTELLRELTTGDWLTMVGAGIANAVSFLCLTKALKVLPIVYVNTINAAQIATGAMVALFWFHEKFTIWLWFGTTTMTFGFLLLGVLTKRERDRKKAIIDRSEFDQLHRDQRDSEKRDDEKRDDEKRDDEMRDGRSQYRPLPAQGTNE